MKVRWSEVVMLVGLYAGASVLYRQVMVLYEQMAANESQMPWLTSFLLGLGSMTLFIILQMQIWGFLRTTAVSPLAPYRPMELLRTGAPFFWRLLGFQLLFFLAFAFVSSIILTVLGILIFRQHVVRELPIWLHALSVFLSVLVLSKPFLLMPALVLSYGYKLIESFFVMQGISLLRRRSLVLAAVLFAAFSALLVIVTPLEAQRETLGWIVQGVGGLLAGLLLIGVYLVAILSFSHPEPDRSTREYDRLL